MLSIQKKKDCCGCNACAQSCPKDCLHLQFDDEGFMYPVIEKTQCVQCGKCEKVCPVLNRFRTEKKGKIECYVAYAIDDGIRSKSSSGGIFTLLAEMILKDGGIVFGAVFDENFQVYHTAIESIVDIPQMRGSKYVQSRIGDTYKKAQNNLYMGRKVLFMGVPCQIAGLKAYLGKEYNNLFTVEVLCHGVPSSSLWKRYLREQEKQYKAKVTNVLFRNKNSGWNSYAMELLFNNSKTYVKNRYKDTFMILFLNNISLRPSCYACRFKDLDRQADLTLGDAWGVEKWMPEMYDNHGTSVILIHTAKGQELFSGIKTELVYKEAEVDKAVAPNAESRKSPEIPAQREKYLQLLHNGASVSRMARLVKQPLIKRLVGKSKRTLVELKKKYLVIF